MQKVPRKMCKCMRIIDEKMANFIDEILSILKVLSEEFCDEDSDESKRNSDE